MGEDTIASLRERAKQALRLSKATGSEEARRILAKMADDLFKAADELAKRCSN
jgi:hypothetical protein